MPIFQDLTPLPRLLDLCGHYHFVPRPCAVAAAQEKGRVERAIRYLREAFFAARPFRDVEDLNRQFVDWRDTVAHARPRTRLPGTRRAVARRAGPRTPPATVRTGRMPSGRNVTPAPATRDHLLCTLLRYAEVRSQPPAGGSSQSRVSAGRYCAQGAKRFSPV